MEYFRLVRTEEPATLCAAGFVKMAGDETDALIITIFLPEFWLHPYGPLTKNLPMLAAILLLHEFEEP